MIEGDLLGRYRVISALGEGGMGRVYLAEDPALKRRVAIKVLPPEFAASGERRSRLLSEARAASALNHPNIVTIYDLGDDAGVMFVAMEVIDGERLREWAVGRPRTATEVVALVRQATRALAVAHTAGLVHRDLKPENLMVRQDGLLKILDFGLARSATVDENATIERTLPGTILGTAPYMSPEQVLGKPAGPASDVFSLGTLTYELLTGRHPFAAATAVDTMHRVLHETPPAPSSLVAGLPVALDFVLAKAMAKDPARRYRDAGEFDLDLETCEAGLGPAAPPHAAAGAGAKGPRAIAVMPFKNIGGNADLNYLGIGLADAVITRLSNSPDLIVRPTSAIAEYENRPVDSRVVARDLEVSAVLDASFQRAGERFRATARLVEMPGGQALWAGKVDVDFADIFAVQDEVAHGIATALTARLAPDAVAAAGQVGDAGPVARAFTPSAEAFELSMRAQEAVRAGTRAGLDRAIELCRRAVELEPGFADAWAQLAFAYHGLSDGGFDPDPVWYDRAETTAKRALEIDPDHSAALFVVAALHVVRGRKLEAFDMLVRSHRRAPNQPMVLHYIGYVLRLSNLYDDAIRADTQGIDLDPSAPWMYWGVLRLYFESGRANEAEVWWERVSTRFAHHPRLREYLLARMFWQGRYEELLAESRRLPDEKESGFGTTFFQAMALVRLGRATEARALTPGMDRGAWNDMDFASYAAAVHAHLGNADEAFRLLARAVELGNDMLVQYENPAFFAPLFDDPRWEPFVAGVRGRVAVYRQKMRWPLEPAAAAVAP
jgi:TolB-like protein/tRNA A-37 threonylcarbamoyl transferase component Bud32